MIRSLIRILLRPLVQILTTIFYWLLGILISVALRLTTLLFRSSIVLTGWVLAYADIRLDGRISRRAITTLLGSGGLWALIGLIAPFLFNLLLREETMVISLRLTLSGFVYGLICGYRVRRILGWGMWAANDGLRLGESSR